MASDKNYLETIIEAVGGVEYRPMMGEYLLYFKGKLIGGVYDNRLLLKKTRAAEKLLPDAVFELPYAGAKEMLVVEDVENAELLSALFNATAGELPLPKKRK